MDILGEERSFITRINTSNTYVYNYKWIIQDFGDVPRRDIQCITSPIFQTSDNEYFMNLYPNGYSRPELPNSSYYDFLTISLKFTACKGFTADVLVQFSILNNKLEVAHRKRGTYSEDHNDIRCNLINHDILYDISKNLLVDKQLTILCTVTKPSITNQSYSIYRSIRAQMEGHQFDICSDLKELLNNKILVDITLVAGGEEVQAHKLILTARSPVFAAMLQNDMKEKNNSRIEIEDVDADTLSHMIEFVYTDKVADIINETYNSGGHQLSKNLLYVANKYDIKGMKLFCEQSILQVLNIYNFVEIFKIAETFCCDLLKQEVLKFIINNAAKIVKTSEFESWKEDLPPMVVDIIKASASTIGQIKYRKSYF